MALQENELRIGNWVMKLWGNHRMPMQVSGIRDGVLYFGEGEDLKFRERCAIESANPIPLTDEWLKMLGFISNEKHKWLYELDFLSVHVNARRVKIIGLGSIDHIQFVHQLQNLYFAHKGEELQVFN